MPKEKSHSDDQKPEWNASYGRRENYLFHPHEEIIRFVSRNIRKRVGFHEFSDVHGDASGRRILDLGCGIGRHVIFAHQMGLDAFGMDHSLQAVREAIAWAAREGIPDARYRIVCADVRQLPWRDRFFDYAISHGVLDSMHLTTARAAVQELARVLAPGALFYCDLISGDDSSHSRDFAGEEIVSTEHERGTVQSYFNAGKIEELAGPSFDLIQGTLIGRENIVAGGFRARYHLVLRKA